MTNLSRTMTTTAAQQVALDNALKCSVRFFPWYLPKLPNQEFDALTLDEEIISFIKDLGHKGDIKFVPDAVVDQGLLSSDSQESKKVQEYPVLLQRREHLSPWTRKSLSLLRNLYLPRILQENSLLEFKSETLLVCLCGSSDGAGLELEVPDDPKGKSIDTCEGTSLKPGVLDTSKADSSESEYESWGDSGDEANVKETNDDEEETDDEFVHTPQTMYQLMMKRMMNPMNVDKEEYDRIDKELYGDVNVRLTDAEQDDEGEEDADMTGVAYVQVE
ncbi:hypothetical protein Tco_0804706 [Tanacetum coccineum]|uniref:Uncharacterized protein n=1 Tax=Tanacetum coccineum TaxID=301880 RepID=A0ABQ5A6S8_9ASTR